MRVFKAKYASVCARSKAPIYPGDIVFFNYDGQLCLQCDSDNLYFINSRG